jgi:hypothetical protein
MFSVPAKVFKAGVLVAEDGQIRTATAGATLAARVV